MSQSLTGMRKLEESACLIVSLIMVVLLKLICLCIAGLYPVRRDCITGFLKILKVLLEVVIKATVSSCNCYTLFLVIIT